MTAREAIKLVKNLANDDKITNRELEEWMYLLYDYGNDQEIPRHIERRISMLEQDSEIIKRKTRVLIKNQVEDPKIERLGEQLKKQARTIESLEESIKTIENATTGFPEIQQIQEKLSQVQDVANQAAKLELKLEKVTEMANTIEKTSKATTEDLKNNMEEFAKATLDATLGESFSNRKSDLIKERKIMRVCLYGIFIVTIIGTIVLLCVTISKISSALTTSMEFVSLGYSGFLVYFPLFLIVWFVIRYFVRRVNEYDHLIEEYANKEALSLSFSRYKETFKEIADLTKDWKPLETFTHSTANELIKNPTHIFPKNKTDRMPIKELKDIFNLWDKLPDNNRSALLDSLKLFIEKNTELELEKQRRDNQIESNSKYDPFE